MTEFYSFRSYPETLFLSILQRFREIILIFHDFSAAAPGGLSDDGVYAARRASCSAVKQEMLLLCRNLPSVMKIQLKRQKGWNLQHGRILAVPAILFIPQKYLSASTRRDCGWPKVMDVCEDGHMAVSDGWLDICVLMNDMGSSRSYSPGGNRRGSAFPCLDAHDPVMDRVDRVRREGRTEDCHQDDLIRHSNSCKASLATWLREVSKPL